MDVYLLKDMLGQGGDHVLYRKIEASPLVYLQSRVLTAFCMFKLCAITMIRQNVLDILR